MEKHTTKRFFEFMFIAVALCCIFVSILPKSAIVACFKYLDAGTTEISLASAMWPDISLTAGAVGLTLIISTILATKYSNGIYYVSLRIADKIDGWDENYHKESGGFWGLKPPLLILWIGLSFSSVLLTYWPSIQDGYFRYDDFEFLSDFRDIPLIKSLAVVHGDHAVPLYRLEVAIMYLLFGVNHVPYNIALLTVFFLTVIFSLLILREIKTGQLGLLLFLALYIGWTMWGESLTGYYCLSVYIQTALFCTMAIWSYLRWEKTEKNIFKKLFTISIVLAVSIDLSGIHVPIAVGIFLITDFIATDTWSNFKNWFNKHKWFVWSLVITCIIYGLFLVYVFKFVNPGTFLYMNAVTVAKGAQPKSSNIFRLYLFLTNGLALSTFVSYYNIISTKLLILINILTFSVLTVLVLYLRKLKINKYYKTYCIGISSIILIIGVMVVIGRQSTGINYVWAAKYSGPAYMWFCILAAFCWNTFWTFIDRSQRPMVFQLAMISVIAVLIFRAPFRYNNIGYPSYPFHILDAVKRQSAVNDIRDKLIKPLFSDGISEVHIPTLDGTFIYKKYDQLFQYNLSHYLDFIVPAGKRTVLYRNQQMQEWGKTRVTTVTDLRKHISSRFTDALSQSGYQQQMYTRSYPLLFKDYHGCTSNVSDIQNMIFEAKSVKLQKEGSLIITSRERTKIKITHGKWDPLTRHVLLVDIKYVGQQSVQPELKVWFNGDLNIPYTAYKIQNGELSQGCKAIDLLQLPAYSLNSNVGNIELHFPNYGKYVVNTVKFE